MTQPGPGTRTGRSIAVKVLNKVNPKMTYAAPILARYLPLTEEKHRATDLVNGVLRNSKTIDIVLEKCTKTPANRISPRLINLIRIGTYELLYCPQTPDHAIINEAVEIAKRLAGKKQTAFVNAILRDVQRHILSRSNDLEQPPITRTLPVTPHSGCKFDIQILPDPNTKTTDFLAHAFSLPRWLIKTWIDRFGLDAAMRICFASNRRPSTYVRPNNIKTTLDELAKTFAQHGVQFEIVPAHGMIKLTAAHSIPDLPGFERGLFSIQDTTAAQPAKLLRPSKQWKILDLCAAPGTKTTQLAELTSDDAKIFATDIDSERLERLQENIQRLDIKSVTPFPYDKLKAVCESEAPFDCLLLDVPCSNTGVLARRPEVRHRITPDAVSRLALTQSNLLRSAAEFIKPCGTTCYSTCSIQSDENTEQIARFLNENPHFNLESELLTLPNAEAFDHDGGYVAVLRKV